MPLNRLTSKIKVGMKARHHLPAATSGNAPTGKGDDTANRNAANHLEMDQLPARSKARQGAVLPSKAPSVRLISPASSDRP